MTLKGIEIQEINVIIKRHCTVLWFCLSNRNSHAV